MKFKDYGADYRAKVDYYLFLSKLCHYILSLQKARGDIKKPGKPDPYAYIQLDRQKLNRRYIYPS